MKYLKFLIVLLSLPILSGCTTNINNTNTQETSSTFTTTYKKEFPQKNNIILSDETYTNNNYLKLNNKLFFINSFNNYFLSNIDLNINLKDLTEYNTKNLITSSLSSITSNDGTIFFSYLNESGIYSFNIATNEILKLNNNKAINLTYYNNSIYYIDNYNLYSYNLNNKATTLLISDKVADYSINNNIIFYKNFSNSCNLYYFELDNKVNQKLINSPIDSFVIYKDNIIFSNSTDNNYIYLLNLSNLETTKVLSLQSSNLKEINNNIYFINLTSPNTLCKLIIPDDLSNFSYSNIYNNYINNYFLTDNYLFIEDPSNPTVIKVVTE